MRIRLKDDENNISIVEAESIHFSPGIEDLKQVQIYCLDGVTTYHKMIEDPRLENFIQTELLEKGFVDLVKNGPCLREVSI